MELQVEALPRCRARPDRMAPAERRWLTRKLLRPGALRLPPQCEQPHDFPTMPLIERRALEPYHNISFCPKQLQS